MKTHPPKHNKLLFLAFGAIIVVLALLGTWHMRPSNQLSTQTTSTAQSAQPVSWHAYPNNALAFAIDLPCENTITSPTADTYGLLGAENPAVHAISCTYRQASQGCSFDVFALPGQYPHDKKDQLIWLRQRITEKTTETATEGGAMLRSAPESGKLFPAASPDQTPEAGTQYNVHILATNNYYFLQSICTKNYTGLADRFADSFTIK